MRTFRSMNRLQVLLLAVLIGVLGGCGTQSPSEPPVGAAVSAEDTTPGLWREMKAQETLNEAVLSLPGVTGTGICTSETGQAAIVVMFAETAAMTKTGAALPASVDGVAVQTAVAGPFTAFTTYCGTSAGNNNECAAGTLGAVVTINGSGGTLYWLSNNHVFARLNAAAIGERIDAPGRFDASCGFPPACGRLSAFEPLRFDGSLNAFDAAIALIQPGTSWSQVEAAGTRGYVPTNTIVPPAAGLAVKKVGRTTGLTTGRIDYVNVFTTVTFGGKLARFAGQIVTTRGFAQPGDSGSLMVTDSGNNPVGLVFGGDAIGRATVSPIAPVLRRFNIRFK